MSEPGSHAESKWIDDLTSDTAVGKAARRALDSRLSHVRQTLRQAGQWGPDSEPIHHLRVATRRASAALDAFGDMLPRKIDRRTRRTLKQLRRAAGGARDADVFLEGVRGWAVHRSPAARPGLHFLLGHAFSRRQAAQATFAAAIENVTDGLDDLFSDVAGRVHGGKKETLKDRARPIMSDLLDEFSTSAGGNLEDSTKLHRVRIIAKRLRYALELFIVCFPPPVRDQIYPHVEQVQELLGQANDSSRAISGLDDLLKAVRENQPSLWDLVRGGIEELRTHHQQRLRDSRNAFADWWRKWNAMKPEIALGLSATHENPDLPTIAPSASPLPSGSK